MSSKHSPSSLLQKSPTATCIHHACVSAPAAWQGRHIGASVQNSTSVPDYCGMLGRGTDHHVLSWTLHASRGELLAVGLLQWRCMHPTPEKATHVMSRFPPVVEARLFVHLDPQVTRIVLVPLGARSRHVRGGGPGIEVEKRRRDACRRAIRRPLPHCLCSTGQSVLSRPSTYRPHTVSKAQHACLTAYANVSHNDHTPR